jgi:polyketide cyclase/dehydrase/lipid transport protein
MSAVEISVDAAPGDVWRVLADGWLYPLWVVGASRIREVDDTWPQTGSKIHHSVGLWPAVLDDDTEVTSCVDGSLLSLRARSWPAGSADVTIHVGAEGAGARVRMDEDVAHGPMRLAPRMLRAPAVQWRNRESLRRLAWLSERRA